MSSNLTDEEKAVLRGIGNCFLEESLKTKEYEEAYASTCSVLATMNITGIKTLAKDEYEITLCRPGLLIGSRGKTIDGIKKSLNIKSLKVAENTVPDYVFPVNLYDFIEYCE